MAVAAVFWCGDVVSGSVTNYRVIVATWGASGRERTGPHAPFATLQIQLPQQLLHMADDEGALCRTSTITHRCSLAHLILLDVAIRGRDRGFTSNCQPRYKVALHV